MTTRMANNNPDVEPNSDSRDITPTAVVPELASRYARLAATILDWFVAGVFIFVPGYMAKRAGWIDAPTDGPSGAFSAAAFGFLTLVAVTAYSVSNFSQTIGKMALRIRVVRRDGSRASLGRIFWARNVPIVLLVVLPSYFIANGGMPMIESIVIIGDALLIFRVSRQCLHDHIANTIVVKV